MSNQPEVVAAGKAALDRWGAGTASVRFICGTFTVHRALEAACARLVGTAASLSFVSAWNANEAVPATLLGEQDIVISDQLNHASIIDAARLAKAITKCQTAVYRHADLADLEEKLAAARDRRTRMVITDGVFSMEGSIAPAARPDRALPPARRRAGRGRLARHGRARARTAAAPPSISACWARSTSSPPRSARRSGGAAGGFVAGSAAVCDYLTQRARPQLFSNALPPTVAASALASVEFLEAHPERVSTLRDNARYFRERLLELGFQPLPGETPIIPVILGETAAAIRMSDLPARRGRLRHRLRLPGRAPGPGARPVPDLRRAHARGPGRGAGRVPESRAGAEADLGRPDLGEPDGRATGDFDDPPAETILPASLSW